MRRRLNLSKLPYPELWLGLFTQLHGPNCHNCSVCKEEMKDTFDVTIEELEEEEEEVPLSKEHALRSLFQSVYYSIVTKLLAIM